MPTYDYRCAACGHALEVFQAISAAPKRKCPSCGRAKLERQIGAGAGFLFKGSGFYSTDYRSKSWSEGAKSDAASAKPDSTAKTESTAKSDSAPSKPGVESAGSPSAAKSEASKPASDAAKSKPASDAKRRKRA
jgi:putative FmdB family regulatory protein